MRTNTSRYEPPKLTTCDKCGLHYYLTNAPHVCAEWTTGQPRTSGVETEAGSTAASKWQVSRYLPSTRSDAQRIAVITAPHPDGGGQDIIECLECVAEIVVTEHNQHAALVAERDRLLESDRFLGDRLEAQAETMARVVAERNNLRIERERLREALRQIAAFNDEGANVALRKHGSYSGFDEPGAVQVAREALASTEQGGETR